MPRFVEQKLDNPHQSAPRVPAFSFEGITHPKRVAGSLVVGVKRGDSSVRVGNASGFLPGEQLLITCRVVPPEVMET